MDPLTMIVSTLAAGALAGLKPTAEQVVKDAYASVKSLIQRKYSKVDLTQLERKPESETKRESVREDLIDAGAEGDAELLARIKVLLDTLEKHAPNAGAAIGVNLKDVKAGAFNLVEVNSEGTGVNIEKGEFGGDINIGKVTAGRVKDSGNP